MRERMLKACVLYFQKKNVSRSFWKTYVEKKFNLELLYLPIILQMFIHTWATTHCPSS